MSNILDNGTVLPSGLLSGGSTSMRDAFKKTYQNTSLRVGLITQSYSINDTNNVSKVATEYDVMTFEQNEDQGSTVITYRHCLAASGFGSIADFFEASLRKLTNQTTKGPVPSPSGQNGAIVLLLCLNGLSDTGVIVSFLSHPDRPTTLVDDLPHLEGEYNGVHIVINSDGSCAFTFKGATDNYGKVTDPSQGNTEVKIEKDGSFQVDHKNTTFRLDKNGITTLTTTSDINATTSAGNLNVTVSQGDVNMTVSQGNVTVTALKDIIIQCQGTATIEGKLIKLGKSAIEAVIKGDTFQKLYDAHTHVGNLGFETTPPLFSMRPSLSKKVVTE